jgi:hypothetical protein
MRRVNAALAVAALLLAAPLGAAAQGEDPPVLTVTPPAPSLGEEVTVLGRSFPPSSRLVVELCGNRARRGSADCDQGTAVNAVAGAGGEFAQRMTIGTPPTPCPCVLRATTVDHPVSVALPLSPAGLPTDLNAEEVFPDVVRSARIVEARVTDAGSSWHAWFGVSPERVLHLTIENTGNVAIHDPPVTISAGKGSEPTGVVEPPELGTIEPGEVRTYVVPFELGTLAFGEYTIAGRLIGFGEPVAFAATTTSYPWLLILIPLVIVVQWLLLRLRNRLRRRLQPQLALPAATGPPEGAGVASAQDASPSDSSPAPESTPAIDEAVLLNLPDALRDELSRVIPRPPLDAATAASVAAVVAERVTAALRCHARDGVAVARLEIPLREALTSALVEDDSVSLR